MMTHTRGMRRRTLRRATGVLATASMVVALAACAPSDSGADAPDADAGEAEGAGAAGDADGTIRAGISYELGTNGYDPMTTSAALTIAANWHTLEGLTELDPATGEAYNALAGDGLEEVDETTYTATLREGAVFHDGSPVTADDVVFSFDRVLDPENNSLYSQFIPFIESVEATDDTTVQINLEYPVGLLAERVAVVKVVPQEAVEADLDEFDANPIGTGPYKMTDNGASGTVVLERFDDYTGDHPAQVAELVWDVLPDATARVNALASGTVSAIDSVPYLDIETLEAQGADVESVQGFGLLFAMFNMESENFSDVRNRQALMYAIDMEKVIDTALLGNGEAASSFVQSTHPNYNEAETVYSYDPEKAKALFEETGLMGQDIKMLSTDHDWVAKVTPLIKENLDELGVNVVLDEGQSAGQYTKIDGGEDYDVLIAPGDPSVFGNDPDLLMRWWYAGDTWTDQRMHWKGQDSYDQVQALLDEALQEGDEAARQELWNETYDLLSNEIPLYPLFHRKVPTAWKAEELSGFEPISLTGLSFVDTGLAG